MREIVHIQAGQCGNQIGAKVRGGRRGPGSRLHCRPARAGGGISVRRWRDGEGGARGVPLCGLMEGRQPTRLLPGVWRRASGGYRKRLRRLHLGRGGGHFWMGFIAARDSWPGPRGWCRHPAGRLWPPRLVAEHASCRRSIVAAGERARGASVRTLDTAVAPAFAFRRRNNSRAERGGGGRRGTPWAEVSASGDGPASAGGRRRRWARPPDAAKAWRRHEPRLGAMSSRLTAVRNAVPVLGGHQ